jgi:hypothetical protein
MLKSTHRFGDAAQISSCNKLIAVSIRGEDTARSLIRFIKALLKKAVNLDAYANEKRAQHDASLKRDNVANTSSELTVIHRYWYDRIGTHKFKFLARLLRDHHRDQPSLVFPANFVMLFLGLPVEAISDKFDILTAA